ncbi:MAG: hypothetical protein AB1757_25010 [Acidobacteriota bacterium]
MNLKKILELINKDSQTGGAGGEEGRDKTHCLSEIEIAAYYENSIPAEKRAGIEHHLADCHDCIDLLVTFSRIAAELKQESPSDSLPNAEVEKLTNKVLKLINEDDTHN